jgi:ParB family chromosome partitioning protein
MKPQSSIEPRGLTQYRIHGLENHRTDRTSSIDAVREKQRREDAIANAIGLHVLSAIAAAVPARLTKRDLIFIVERLLVLLGKRRIEVLARNRGIKKTQSSDSTMKLMDAYIRKADEGDLGRILVEIVILHFTRMQLETGTAFKDAAQHYNVDIDAISQKVKTEFAAKEKAQAAWKTKNKTQKSARLTIDNQSTAA